MEKAILSDKEIDKALDRMIYEIMERHSSYENILFVGIRTRGVPLAKRLQEKFSKKASIDIDLCELDITLYRDDLDQVSDVPIIKGTNIDFDITNRNILLIDDVLYTGRTIRAAIQELSDFGRPAKIELLVLIDRGHRELPIEAQYVGKSIPSAKKEYVKVNLLEVDGIDQVILGVCDEKKEE